MDQPRPRTPLGQYTQSIAMIREIFAERMFPMTLKGIEAGMQELGR